MCRFDINLYMSEGHVRVVYTFAIPSFSALLLVDDGGLTPPQYPSISVHHVSSSAKEPPAHHPRPQCSLMHWMSDTQKWTIQCLLAWLEIN